MASNPFSLELDTGPSSIEPESLLPRLLLETPTRPNRDNSASTPKRKRGEFGDDKDDHATPTKRSNLEKGLIPDSFDMSSQEGSVGSGNDSKAQKLVRLNGAVNRAAPSTSIKTFDRSQLDDLRAHGLLRDESPSPLTTGVLSPLIRPRICDFTTSPEPGIDREAVSAVPDLFPYNNLSSGSAQHGSEHDIQQEAGDKQCPPPPTDMNLSAIGNDDIFYEFSRPRATMVRHTQHQRQEDTNTVLPTPLSTPRKRTTTTTPQKPVSALHKTPAIAPAYVPEYLSTDSPVKLKDPKQFCIHPPFWKRWPTTRYVRFATFLQEFVNLTPFAEQQGLTIEEVRHVFHSIVTEPLLDETEKLAEVGTKRMEAMFKVLNPKAGPAKWKTWRSEASSVQGELCGVRPGVVQLANENGELIEVPYIKLFKADQELVLRTVTNEERGILLREVTVV